MKRAVFHEITRDAINRAFQSPRQVLTNLVQAQEARRILDRIAGPYSHLRCPLAAACPAGRR